MLMNKWSEITSLFDDLCLTLQISSSTNEEHLLLYLVSTNSSFIKLSEFIDKYDLFSREELDKLIQQLRSKKQIETFENTSELHIIKLTDLGLSTLDTLNRKVATLNEELPEGVRELICSINGKLQK